VTADRGGDVTYHGPGQLVGYPIVKLRARGLTVPCYVRALELSIISVLSSIGINARIDEGHVGELSIVAHRVGDCIGQERPCGEWSEEQQGAAAGKGNAIR